MNSGGDATGIVASSPQKHYDQQQQEQASERRQQRVCFITADTVRQLWTTLNGLKQAKTATNVQNISQRAQKTYGWTAEDTATKLADCAQYGLLVRKHDPSTNQELYFQVESVAQEQEHDRFCFECHDAGTVIPCSSCFRVYHAFCKPNEGIPFICNACQIMMSPTKSDPDQLTKQLEGMLAYANTRGGPNFNAIPNAHSPAAIEHHRLLVIRPVDLTVMRGKVAKGEYANADQFFNDFRLLVHNMTILYGKESNLANLARDLLKQIRSEVDNPESANQDDDEILATLGAKQSGKGGKRKQDATMDGLSDSPTTKRGRKKSDVLGSEVSANVAKSPSKQNNVSVQTDQAKIVAATGAVAATCNCDSKYRQLIIDLQQHWLVEYKQEREKSLTELAEKLHKEFLADQDKLRSDMLNQFKRDLEQTKQDLDVRYSQQLKQEIQKQVEKHKRIIAETKKKQWCWQCEAEAIYHCCWNTAYCSVECQQQHWPIHRKTCRRKKQQQQQP